MTETASVMRRLPDVPQRLQCDGCGNFGGNESTNLGVHIDIVPGRGASATLMQIDAVVNQQALMASHTNDFKLMMIATSCAMLLAMLPRHDGPAMAVAAMK